jgi:hypothetical protein
VGLPIGSVAGLPYGRRHFPAKRPAYGDNRLSSTRSNPSSGIPKAAPPPSCTGVSVDNRLPASFLSHFFLDKFVSKVCNAGQCSA